MGVAEVALQRDSLCPERTRGAADARPAISVAALAVLLLAGCLDDRVERRELTPPLGPDGTGAAYPPEPQDPLPPLPLELELGGPTPQLTIRSSRIGTGEPAPVQPPAQPAAAGPSLHFQSIVIDTHVDTPQGMADAGFDLLVRHETGHLDLPRMRQGGLDAAFFSIWVSPSEFPEEAAWERALTLFDAVYEAAWRSPQLAVVDTSADLRAAVGRGQTAILFGVEGAHALGTGDPELVFRRLRMFRELGARYMTLTWTNDNPLGHASTGDHPERGLTELGTHVVREMQRIGMVVDVSHVSDQTFWDVMAIATQPVMASHSSARALADHPRNMSDDMIRRVGENGGVVCVNYFTWYIDRPYAEAIRRISGEHGDEFAPLRELPYTEQGPAFRELARQLEPTLSVPDVATVADHLMHIIEAGGVETACLGSDFDGVPDLPAGLDDVTALPALTRELRRRGLTDQQVRLVLGENVLRVLAANEPGESTVGPILLPLVWPYALPDLGRLVTGGTGEGTGEVSAGTGEGTR